MRRRDNEAATGATDEVDAGEDDVGGDRERDQQVEPLPAGELDYRYAGDHTCRGPDIGEEVRNCAP